MAWALWLAVPIGATSIAAVWTWLRGIRARRAEQLDTPGSMQAHEDYLAALVIPARSMHRPRADPLVSGTVVVTGHHVDEAHRAAS